MPIEVDVPDFGVVEFPDGTSEEQILNAIKTQVPEAKHKPPSTLEGLISKGPRDIADVFKSAASLYKKLPEESVFGISPEDVPSGVGTTAPGITIPLSALGKTTAGAVGYATSPKGLLELGALATPAAPAVYVKWAADMLKGGYEAGTDLINTLGEMVRDSFNTGMVKANQLGITQPENPDHVQEQVQRVAEDAVNAAVAGLGGVAAGAGAIRGARRNLIPRVEPITMPEPVAPATTATARPALEPAAVEPVAEPPGVSPAAAAAESVPTRPAEPAPTAPAALPPEAPRPAPEPAIAPITPQAAAEIAPGPGAASPAEFAKRLREPPSPPVNLPVAVDAVTKPDVEVVRRNKDYHLFNAFNSGQWSFGFGQLGEFAKAAWERMALGEFKMRESIKRDIQIYVRDLLTSLPREMRKKGGEAFFDVVDGRRMEDIVAEWEGKAGGDKVIVAAENLKTRLEEIRTTIRDTKRDSYRSYLQGLNRESLETMFRNTISDQVDTSKMTKEQFADGLALSEFPDDWGIADGSYLPHLFFGNWKVEARIAGEQQPSFVTRAKTAAEAKAKIFELSRKNPEYANAKWTVGQDVVIPADMIRLGDSKFWNMISRMKEQTAGEVNVKEAVQGIVGRKASKQKWFGSLQKREGFANYSKDFEQVMSAYLNGFHRWKELSSMQRDVQPLIDKVRSEGRINAAQRLDDIMENLWGKPTQSTILFDAFLRQIPGFRDYFKPLALDRWSRNIRSIVSFLTLSTPRFALINRLQPLQGLYPIVGERLLAKGKALQHTAEGKALLDEAGVAFDPGQYADVRGGVSKVRDILERLRGESTNQQWAFLSMYLHGLEQGMPKPEAMNYAKLRGQLMTQFTPLISDTPPILHGPLMSAAFQFKRFPIKQAELIVDMVRNGQIGGIARMLAVFGLVGGASLFLRQAWTDKSKRLAFQRMLTKELGEQGANALMYGLPGLLNADLSGSLVLADEPFGDDIYAKAGRTVAGPAVSMPIDITRAVTTEQREPMSAKEKAIVTLRRFPTLRPIAELLAFNDDEILAPDGETKYRRKVADALVSLGSFRSAHESNQRLAIDAIVELKKEEAKLKNAYYVAKAGGEDTSKVLADIDAFNKRWPEVRITRGDLGEYAAYRRSNARKTDTQRIAGKKYRKLIVP